MMRIMATLYQHTSLPGHEGVIALHASGKPQEGHAVGQL